MDVVYVAALLVLFGLTVALVQACARKIGGAQ
jgi:hypothetical protein